MLNLSADPDLLARALESVSDKMAQAGGLKYQPPKGLGEDNLFLFH